MWWAREEGGGGDTVIVGVDLSLDGSIAEDS